MAIQILTTRAAAEEGRPHGLETGLRAGRLVRVRPGAYAPTSEWHDASPEERHRAAMEALVLTARRPPVFARHSAALLHGIPVLGGWPELPHLLDSELGAASRRSPSGTVVHRPRHVPEVCEVSGMLATTPLATALALASSLPLAAGVAAIDHVLASGVGRDEFGAVFEDWLPFHGSRRAARCLAIATGRSETPLESVSLTGMHLAGLPEPEQQTEVVVRGRRYRLDFHWDGVAGEADGRGKYRSPADLWDEKQREDDIRSLGLTFVRWTWEDAWARSPMLEKLAAAGVRPIRRTPARVAPRFVGNSA